MAQRTMCLCEGKYIGIESIFTVVNGRQINIPEKVEALREKSRRNQLTCPCGCGAILTLVAGDRNLREQHFRLKEGEHEKDCHLVTEGKCSVDSKIVLKCWMDDKLQDANIESRVPISAVENHERKYEFTLLSRTKSIAVSYSHERVNLSDEKFDILESNSKGIRIIYIVDALNGGGNGQYPESLMKIQTRQGYCLYLSIDDIDYYKAKLKAVYFEQDIDGLWQEITFASGLLSQFDISEFGDIFYLGKALKELLEIAKEKFTWEQESIRQKRERERIEREEYLKKIIAENAKRQEEKNKEMIRQKEEAERRRAELAEKQRLEAERKERERKEKEDAFKAAVSNNFENQETQIRDADGNRWVKCEFCGKIAMEKEFSSYGGAGRVNLGTCYDCSKNTSVIREKITHPVEIKKRSYDPNVCPDCGGQLKEKSGKFGLFIGCSNYPSCRYTRKITGKKY